MSYSGKMSASCPKVEESADTCVWPIWGQRKEHPCPWDCLQELLPMMVVHPSFTGVDWFLYPWGKH